MDPLERAVASERAWIARCEDVGDLLDKMAEYRETAREAERAGNTRGLRRVGELLELAEDRAAELKAAKLRVGRRSATMAEARSRPEVVAAPVAPKHDVEEELRVARAEIAATRAAHRTAVLAREAAERREQEAAEEREQLRAERERRRAEEREREAARVHVAEEREREAERVRAVEREREAQRVRAAEEREREAARVRVAEREREAARVRPAEREREAVRSDVRRDAAAPSAPPVRPVATLPRSVVSEAGESAASPPKQPAPKGPVRRAAGPSSASEPAQPSVDAGAVMPSAEELPAHTGADLAALRRSSGLAQGAFAQLLGVTQGTVSKAEGNPRAVVGPALRLAMWTRQRKG